MYRSPQHRWPQIVSDVLAMPVELPEQRDAECAGAAILAGVGAGVVNSIEEGCGMFKTARRTLNPIADHVLVYEKLYQKFERKMGNV